MVDASFLAKIVATPLLIAFVYVVERRFGHAVAGLVFGFPLTSALATSFLAAEQGAGFVRAAAPGLLAGIATFGVYLLAYAHAAARGLRWPAAVALALAAYAPAAVALGVLDLAFVPAIGVAIAVLAVAAGFGGLGLNRFLGAFTAATAGNPADSESARLQPH